MYTKELQEKHDDRIKEIVTKHEKHKHILFKIVHEENTGTKTSEFLTQKTIAWNRRSLPPFIWEMNRPETGVEKFESSCPYCHARFEANIDSFDEIAKTKKSEQNHRKKWRIVALILFSIILSGITWPGFFKTMDISYLLFIGFFGGLIVLGAISGALKSVDPKGITDKGFEDAGIIYSSGIIHYKTIDSY